MLKIISNKEFIERLTEEDRQEYQRLKGIENLEKISRKNITENVKKNLDTSNKLIIPDDISKSDNDVIKQLSENLQNITPEDVDGMCKEMDEAEKKMSSKIATQELKDFRELWKEKIEGIDNETKEKIIEKSKGIKVNVEKDNDGSRLIEFSLNGKIYKILDPKLKGHSDDKYNNDTSHGLITNIINTVEIGGMWGNNIKQWENKKLAKYVKEKGKEGLHIPSEKEILNLLRELGKLIDSDKLNDEIALFMYLTGMDGEYWLSMKDFDSRSKLVCDTRFNCFHYIRSYDTSYANLCMFASRGGNSFTNIFKK